MGIGLTLVRSLVELHNGSVSAESEGVGRGSRFTIKLPISERVPTGEAKHIYTQPLMAAAFWWSTTTSVSRLLTILLQKFGNHEIEVAYDGPTALEQVAAFAPEVVLLDIGLPRMEGYEVACKIRSTTSGASPFLVTLTGYGRTEDISKSKTSGFDEHLVKPPSVETLQALLAHPRLKQPAPTH